MIKSAAIRTRTGEVVTGINHSECIRKMVEQRLPTELAIQGFITAEGVFVDRHLAGRIAFESGQIKRCWNVLMSEDLRDTDGFDWKTS